MSLNSRAAAAAFAALAGLVAVPAIAAPVVEAPAATRINGQYIVTLDRAVWDGRVRRSGLGALVQTLLARVGGAPVVAEYRTALLGFSARLTPAQAEALAATPGVRRVEADQRVTADDTATQLDAPWGLDRLDTRPLVLDGAYRFPLAGGEGAHLYILDTGLQANHIEFAGRVGVGRNFASNSRLAPAVFSQRINPTDTRDCDGHGTHVAGTAAGLTYGVAKSAIVHPVRVLDCRGSGSLAGVIGGIDWVAENAIAPAVANLSLGGDVSASIDEAVEAAVAAGVVVVVSAGNSDIDACLQSPARVPSALTVGASTIGDARAAFSNVGECVDLFAPGQGIVSASHIGTTRSRSLSGTSMAAPHVAGVAALLRAAQPEADVDTIVDALLGDATTDVLSNVGPGSPNLLLHLLQPTP